MYGVGGERWLPELMPKILSHDAATRLLYFFSRTGNVKSRCALLVVHFLQ
jgi:hypothetical protein